MDRIEQREYASALDRAEHRAHVNRAHAARAIGDRLIEQRQTIAQGTVRRARQFSQRIGFEDNAFGIEDMLHLAGDLCRQQALEIEFEAARQHGDRKLLRIRRRQQELHVRRRLFERLEQRVERRLRQHVHFVDQIDLEAAARRGILRVFDDVAHIVDAGVAGGIDLEQIDETPGVDVDTGAALATRSRRLAALAVQRFGEDARNRRLADTARAGEQERMMHAIGIERIAERAHDVFLADQLGKPFRPPFARKDLIRHWCRRRKPAPILADAPSAHAHALRSPAPLSYGSAVLTTAQAKEGGSPASCIPAPESFTTVAAFRPWRGLQTIVAGEPAGPP